MKDPIIEEQFSPDRTLITLSLEKKQAIKTSDKTEESSGNRIKAYSLIGARGIWTTHFHELCLLENKLKSCKSTVGNLHAEIDEFTHQRIFSIQCGTGNGESYAWDIAAQYHLTAEEIVNSKRTIKM